jgi:hypothetical protein
MISFSNKLEVFSVRLFKGGGQDPRLHIECKPDHFVEISAQTLVPEELGGLGLAGITTRSIKLKERLNKLEEAAADVRFQLEDEIQKAVEKRSKKKR